MMRTGFIAFIVICVAHLVEHIAQAVQVYALNMPLHKSGGVLGMWFPVLMHSEALHYAYALVMLIGLWIFRNRFSGQAYALWMTAFAIQFWHHFEHALLLWQALTGENFFGAPQPISVIQFTGFLFGDVQSGFDGLLKMSHFGICDCPGASPGTVHRWTWKLLFVRRLEVHLLYNALVSIPMFVAMACHRQHAL